MAADVDLNELRKQKYNATLIGIHEATPGLRIFRIRPDSGQCTFTPGQFTTLGLYAAEPGVVDCLGAGVESEQAKLYLRAYSFSHPVLNAETARLYQEGEIDFVEFYIVLVTPEPSKKLPALTPRLFALEEQARLFIGKITGHYVLKPEEVSQEKHFVFCGTGTGEAPHNTMVWSLLNQGYQGKITCIVCVRKYADLAYWETYKSIEKAHPNVRYIVLVTREPDVKKTHIQDYVSSGDLEKEMGEKLSPERHAFYLCGNPAMIGIPKVNRMTGEKTYPEGKKGLIQLLEEQGFQADQGRELGNIHFEKYW